ncbi:SHOCT domain-containing protein [Vallitalea okinawensis]|uniref:SHOCT domain-containing protein n=1 Tax=Vallitalea okinawensis TaxID=2078660 RepID=UPI000CFDB688|nr:SHOCT domain-containing protein [Vallitalea okinawensis]
MRHKIRPSKQMSKFTFFIGILFCIIGVIFLVFAASSGIFIGVPFLLIWTGIAVYITYYHYRNGFTDNPIGLYDIDVEESNPKKEENFGDKLRELEQLKADGLITESEYRKKRSEIMDKEW